MTADQSRLVLASREADQAKRQLASTLGTLQHRLRPATLADSAWSGIKDKGSDLRDDAVDAIKTRPAVAAGGVAAALLLLARRPLLRAVRKAAGRDSAAPDADPEENEDSSPPTAPPAGRSRRRGKAS